MYICDDCGHELLKGRLCPNCETYKSTSKIQSHY
ncbi:MAG: hypothetical protein [Siphoviridae sp. ctjeG17]|nr:MAG: hypothetical protein [Siphoviridae sp. ctjeG17]